MHRRHFDVALGDGERVACVMKGRSLRLAVGDRVTVERTADGSSITAVAPRTNLVYRSDAFKDKLLAANVTQIAAVVASDVALDEDLLNRWIIAAEAAQCRFVLLANKATCRRSKRCAARLAPYAALGYTVVPISAKRDPAPARPWLAHQHTVLVGQSGMGKSTLINALVPGAAARTTDVSAALKSGRHTTTSTALYALPELGERHLDRRFARHEGLRPRACRRRRARRGLRGDAAVPRPLPVPRLPPRRGAGLRGYRGGGARAHRAAAAGAIAHAHPGKRDGEPRVLRHEVRYRDEQDHQQPQHQRPPDEADRRRQDVGLHRIAEAQIGSHVGIA